MKIAYFANPNSIHDCKWINHFAQKRDIIVICCNQNIQPTWLSPNIQIYPILPVFSALNFIKTSRVVKKIKVLLIKENVEIIHSMYAVPNALWADMVAKENHIVTTRGSDILVDYLQTYHQPKSLLHHLSYWIMRRKINRALKGAKWITSTSIKQQNAIHQIVTYKKKCLVIRTGVDVSKFTSELPVIGSSTESIIIFCPRSMKPIYNLELLLSSVELFITNKTDKSINVELRIINDQPNTAYSDSILELIESKNLGHFVTVLPALSQEQMLVEYLRSSLVIMIPKSDGTPVSAIEAMLSKRPLILGALDYDHDLFNTSTVWKIAEFTAAAISDEIQNSLLSKEGAFSKIKKAYSLALENANVMRSLDKIEGLYKKIKDE